MDANLVEQCERMGWRFIGVLATLIIVVCVWLPLANAINFGRFVKQSN